LRVVYAGTPSFAVPALEALVLARHEVVLVLTQPDRPSGRGLKLTPSPVAVCAERHGLRTSKPESLRTPQAREEIAALTPDVMVVAAYGLILPQVVLDVPRQGCINIHASLLPRWRGAAPVHRALLAGDPVTGISIMCMDAGLDTGPVLLEKPLSITPDDTTGSLTDKLARLGAEAVVEALAALASLPRRPQDPSKATYAAKVSKAESVVDWSRPAEEIVRQVRAFNPAPGAQATIHGLRIKIWEANSTPDRHPPGKAYIAPGGLVVGCGTGSLQIGVVQREGGRRMTAEDFLRGNPWPETPIPTATH
jgi:methionyl-tRNA formyltransferase